MGWQVGGVALEAAPPLRSRSSGAMNQLEQLAAFDFSLFAYAWCCFNSL